MSDPGPDDRVKILVIYETQAGTVHFDAYDAPLHWEPVDDIRSTWVKLDSGELPAAMLATMFPPKPPAPRLPTPPPRR